MPRTKKTVKKTSAKANVIVNINSNNKRKVVSHPRSSPTSVTHFVSPTPQSNMNEGILLQLMHHVMKPKEHEKPREIELPPKHHVPTKVYVASPPLVPDVPKIGFREPTPKTVPLAIKAEKSAVVAYKPSILHSGHKGFKAPEEHDQSHNLDALTQKMGGLRIKSNHSQKSMSVDSHNSARRVVEDHLMLGNHDSAGERNVPDFLSDSSDNTIDKHPLNAPTKRRIKERAERKLKPYNLFPNSNYVELRSGRSYPKPPLN